MGKFFHNCAPYLASLVLVSFLFVPATQVFAEDSSTSSAAGANVNTTVRTDLEKTSTGSGETNKMEIRGHNFGKDKLEGERLNACKEIEKNLTTRSTHLSDLVTNMEHLFTGIAQRVENYYITKLVPAGKVLPNYDALVADITTKENAIAPLVDAANKDFTGFTCGSDNPKAQITQFITDMQAVTAALHDYRTSIKNLIVAIRTLGGGDKPEPSTSPAATSSSTLSR